MKLYVVKVSPCCRAVWLYCLRNKLPVEIIELDLFAGEHKSEDFLKLNPHGEVPVLTDGENSVFEACAVLRYLAYKYTNHKDFGKNSAEKWKVFSYLTWASSELHRIVGYRIIYPQFFEKYHLPNDANDALVEKGMEELTKVLETLEHQALAFSKFLCGDQITIADLYVGTVLTQLEWIEFDFKLWPNIIGWLAAIKKSNHWEFVHEKHNGFLKELKNN